MTVEPASSPSSSPSPSPSPSPPALIDDVDDVDEGDDAARDGVDTSVEPRGATAARTRRRLRVAMEDAQAFVARLRGRVVARLPHQATSREVRRAPLPWRRVLWQALVVWGSTRLALFAVTALALLFVTSAHPQGQPAAVTRVDGGFVLSRWPLWDGDTYLSIAHDNYPRPIDAAFFPLYPLLTRALALLLHQSDWLGAALLVSNAGTYVAFVGIGLLTLPGRTSAATAAWSSLRVLAAYPLAFFLAAAYTDGLFLAWATLALVAAQRRAWWWAAAWALLAGLTRPTAVVLVLPLLWEFGRAELRSRGLRRRFIRDGTRLLQALALAGAVPFALGLFALYCWRHFGDPLAFVHAQALFGIHGRAPWQTVALVVRQVRTAGLGTFTQTRILVDALPLVVLAGATLVGLRSRPVSSTLYLAGLLLLCLTSPIVDAQFPDAVAGAGRFVLAAVPLWLDLGRWTARWPSLEPFLLSAGWMLQAVLIAFVVTNGWLI